MGIVISLEKATIVGYADDLAVVFESYQPEDEEIYALERAVKSWSKKAALILVDEKSARDIDNDP